jgi:hypothetical protein
MRNRDHFRKSVLTAGAALALFAPAAQAKSVHALYDFSDPSDGAYPEAGVILDKAGNLYGTLSKVEPVAAREAVAALFSSLCPMATRPCSIPLRAEVMAPAPTVSSWTRRATSMA